MNRLVLLIAVFVVFALPALPQSDIVTGQIRGRIVDPAGDAIPLAGIHVRNTATGLVTSVTSGETGEYRFLILPPGVYELRVEREGFASKIQRDIPVLIGQIVTINFQLEVGAVTMVIDVTTTIPLTESERTHQSTTIDERYIRQLPIDRRDYLTYAVLAPGITDSDALADASDFRPVQTASSGISFFGNNGRGNSVRIDGGEANDDGGGIRQTVSQEAVQEFQINRGNYSAELGASTAGVINIVSKSGTNFLRGSLFGFFRHQHLDAGDPFARSLINGISTRVKPPSKRQQFGAALGGPLAVNRTFFFAAFEGLEKRESNSVSILTDPSIFEPTPEQTSILATLPPALAAPLRQALTATPVTKSLFETNNGVFPLTNSDYKFSLRLDHSGNQRDQWFLRYNSANVDERNPNTRALVGLSRGIESSHMDHTGLLRWTRHIHSNAVNQLHFQFNYSDHLVSTRERYGPELNITGFGFFNRDIFLPSNSIARRYEIDDDFSWNKGSLELRAGGQVLLRGVHVESQTLFPGRFNFGPLSGGVVHAALASSMLTALQTFNLGLPLFYQQGFGNPVVSSTTPFYALYVQSGWRATRNLKLDLGLRYELDDRRSPLPTDSNNIAPRFGFAWDPKGGGKTTVRGGYGIFYAPTNYFVDWVSNALNNIDGKRQIAQVLTTIQTPGPASASNIFQTLTRQGVITLPSPNRSIVASDLQQFGIQIVHEGPLPPQSVLFRNSDDFVNSYSQQASLGVERLIGPDWMASFNYLFARTLKIVRPRDNNVLAAPIDPALGVRVWSLPYFKQPLLLQDNIYESTGRAFYHGFTAELTRRFTRKFSVNLNYTLGKAIDEAVDYSTDFGANDQLNLRAERALSSFDQRHKLVTYGSLEMPLAFTITSVLRAESGRPFNLLAGYDLNQDRNSNTDRPAFAGRNTGKGPDFWSVDLRISKRLRFGETTALELIGEAFNALNRLNFRSVNNSVGNIPGPFNFHGRKDRSPSQPLGFTSAFEARRLQLGLRLSF